MPKMHGIATVRADGDLFGSSEASLDVGGFTRTTKFIRGAAAGYNEAPAPSVVEMKLEYEADTDLVSLSNITDAVIDFASDTGDEYVIPMAWVMEPAKLDNDGTVPLKFEGKPAIKK